MRFSDIFIGFSNSGTTMPSFANKVVKFQPQKFVCSLYFVRSTKDVTICFMQFLSEVQTELMAILGKMHRYLNEFD